MRLRTQVVLGLNGVGLLLCGLLFLGVGPYLRATFTDIERVDVERNVERAVNVLSTETAALESLSHDWGAWDETADYVRGFHPAYVEENLTPDTFANLRLTTMAFYDASGRLIRADGFDLDSGESSPPSGDLIAVASDIVPTDRAEDDTECIAGLVSWEGGVALVAVHPVLGNEHQPPAYGTLLVARALTASEIDRLSEQIRLPLSIRAIGDPGRNSGTLAALSGGGSDNVGIVVRSIDEGIAAGSMWLRDVRDVPIAVLEVLVPRDAFLVGVSAAGATTAILIAAFVLLGSGFLLFLHRRVLGPATRLTDVVTRIRESNDVSKRVSVRGKDELALLGRNINGMLETIEESRAAIQRSERKYRNLFESSRDPIYITAADGRFIDVNPAFVDLLGYTMEELESIRAADLYERREDRDAFRTAIEEQGFLSSYPITLRKKNGEIARCLLTSNCETLAGTEEVVYQGIIRDVTELLRQQEELTYLATHDPLTGLLTRGALDDRLNLEIARAVRNLDRLAVFYLDLDRFKEVNDTHGHAAGDHVLQEVATKLREALRASDSVARLGGDEFVAVLPGIDSPQDAEMAADKILTELRDAFRRAEQARGLSVSIGIALFPDDAEDAVHLLQRADRAMYFAKNHGRDGWNRYEKQANSPSRS